MDRSGALEARDSRAADAVSGEKLDVLVEETNQKNECAEFARKRTQISGFGSLIGVDRSKRLERRMRVCAPQA